MSDATIIAVVTIVCTMITTVVTLILRSGVIALIQTVGEQTKELAKTHQYIISQDARISQMAGGTNDATEQKVSGNKKAPSS